MRNEITIKETLKQIEKLLFSHIQFNNTLENAETLDNSMLKLEKNRINEKPIILKKTKEIRCKNKSNTNRETLLPMINFQKPKKNNSKIGFRFNNQIVPEINTNKLHLKPKFERSQMIKKTCPQLNNKFITNALLHLAEKFDEPNKSTDNLTDSKIFQSHNQLNIYNRINMKFENIENELKESNEKIKKLASKYQIRLNFKQFDKETDPYIEEEKNNFKKQERSVFIYHRETKFEKKLYNSIIKDSIQATKSI